MNNIIYTELREKAREIQLLEQKREAVENEKAREQVAMALETMVGLSGSAVKEGLLALEMGAETLAEQLIYKEHLKALVFLVVDGTDPSLIEEISLEKYFARDMRDYEGLTYLIFLKGILAIQQGENTLSLKQKLEAMLTEEIEKVYERRAREAEAKEREAEPDLSRVDAVCAHTYSWNMGDDGYLVTKLSDYVIANMADRDLQRLLREMEIATLEVALKGLGSKAKRHVFNNMSKRLAVMVADDIEDMEEVRTRDMAEANQKLLDTLIGLIGMGEVNSAEYGYLGLFFDNFNTNIEGDEGI